MQQQFLPLETAEQETAQRVAPTSAITEAKEPVQPFEDNARVQFLLSKLGRKNIWRVRIHQILERDILLLKTSLT